MASVAKRVGYAYNSKSLRKSFCITSYFRKPDQGVRDWEELSRSSAFLIKSRNPKKLFHVISAAHVTHPFRFPHLYPEEYDRFLSFLTETDTKVELQVRQLETGELLKEFSLFDFTHIRVDSDLVIGHLKDETSFLDILKSEFGIDHFEPLKLITDQCASGSNVDIIGHDFTMNSNGHHVLVPTSLPGILLGSNAKKAVVSTQEPSVMGLCGGPALLVDEFGNPTDYVIGMVEGRINKKPAGSQGQDEKINQVLEDTTLLVSAEEVLDFVSEVETIMNDIQYTKPQELKKKVKQPSLDASEANLAQTVEELLRESMSNPEEQTWNPINRKKTDDIDF